MFAFGFVITIIFFLLFYRYKNCTILSKIPIIFSAGICIILILKIFNINYEIYQSSAKFISYMIAPATLAFAYPLYENSNFLTKNKRALYFSILVGAFVAVLSTYICASVFHINLKVIISMLPKSTTMPIAVEISKIIGGSVEITACAVVMTGVLGALLGHCVLRKIHIKNDIAIGLAMGSASHVIGTAACAEKQKSKQVAAGTIALILAGFFSAIIIPLIKHIASLLSI